MKDKTILLFGGYSEIGIAIAEKFLSIDYSIFLVGRNLTKLNNTKRMLVEKYSNKIEIYKFDALDYTEIEKFYDSLKYIPNII